METGGLSSIDKLNLTEYELLQTIGEGTFAKVKAGRKKLDGKLNAIKIMEKFQIIKYKQIDHIYNEITILTKIKFPFITNMHGFNQDSKYIYLCLELINGGEFFNFLRKRGNLTKEESMYLLYL